MLSNLAPSRVLRTRPVVALMLASLAASLGCDQEPPPRVIASIDRMVVFGDCDTGDNPGDFFFDLTLEEVVYPIAAVAPTTGRAPIARHRSVGIETSASDSPEPDYVVLDVIESELIQRHPSPDPVDVRRLRVSAPYPVDERFELRATLSVYENDPSGPQWTAEESRPMTWYPDESCWKRYGDRGCESEPSVAIWQGDLDLGREGDTCDVEIDWSIYVVD